MHRALALAVCILGCGLSAFAVDGVVLINQNSATVGLGGCDTPGFPITICVSGSYRLSGNLIVPSALGVVAIEIRVPNVTLDLNGFSITTVANTFGTAVNYTGPTPGRITIENGTIFGFVSPYFDGSGSDNSIPPNIINGGQSVLKDLILVVGIVGGSSSVELGAQTRIVNLSAPDFTINVACPTLITNSVANALQTFGGSGCAFVGNATAH